MRHDLNLYKEKYPEENINDFYDLILEQNSFSRDNLKRHFTASAWVLHPDMKHVLLCHHKKLNKWIQVGGHADGDLDLENVARKECYEEAGIRDLELIESFFDLDIHQIPEIKGIPAHQHFDVRYLFRSLTDELILNHEVNDLKWVPLSKVSDFNNSDTLARMVRKTYNKFKD